MVAPSRIRFLTCLRSTRSPDPPGQMPCSNGPDNLRASLHLTQRQSCTESKENEIIIKTWFGTVVTILVGCPSCKLPVGSFQKASNSTEASYAFKNNETLPVGSSSIAFLTLKHQVPIPITRRESVLDKLLCLFIRRIIKGKAPPSSRHKKRMTHLRDSNASQKKTVQEQSRIGSRIYTGFTANA